MIKKSIEFPIHHLEGNLVFSSNGDVTAYYEVFPVDYAYRSDSEKREARLHWIKLFRILEGHIHILSIPHFFDLQNHQEKLKQEVADGPLQENALRYLDRMTKALEKYQKKPTDQRIYIGIRLKRIQGQFAKNNPLQGFSFHWKGFRRYLETSAGVASHTILDEEMLAYQEQEKTVFQDVSSCLTVRRVNVPDLVGIIHHHANRESNNHDVPANWKPRIEKLQVGDYKSIRSNSKDIENLMLGEYEVAMNHMTVRRVQAGAIKESWLQFLYLSYLPDDLRFPDGEWLYWLQHLPFPVDVSIRINVMSNDKAVQMIAKQKRRLGHHVDHTHTEGKQQDLDLEKAYAETVREESHLLRDHDPILETTVTFCIHAPTKEELYSQSQQLMNLYQNRNREMKVVVPPGDQFYAFHEFLPGSVQLVTDYIHKLKPPMVASSMINASQFLGDQQGVFVGFTGPAEFPRQALDRPVFIDQSLAAQGGSDVDTKSLGILLVGLTGYGKSYASSQLVYQAMHHLGSKVILIDSKGERGNWLTDLPGCQGNVSLTRIDGDPKYRGMLDPFTLFSKEEAPLYAKDFLLQLVQVGRQHEWHHIMQESVQTVKWMDNPSMTEVLNQIKKKDQRLYRVLALYESFPFSQLVFGNGEPPQHRLHVNQPLNIIQIDELRIPDRNKDPKQYDEIEILSKALMTPITGFINQLVKKDRHFNQIWWEEAWIPLSSEAGRRAVNEGIRMGRYWNSSTLLVTQNPSDVPRELVNNMGIKCIFKTKDENEVTRALEILEMENNATNRHAIQSLKEGECFLRDVYGRVGRMYFHCLFEELRQAFDTTPPLRKGK